jgi:ABC-type transport system involved in multi-copper enzyme maturation permease subunit
MAVFTIAGLTIKEAMRRRTLIGALMMGLLVLGLSLLLLRIRSSMLHTVAVHRRPVTWYVMQYTIARSIIATLCLSSIKSLGGLFAVLLAGGAVSSEIERGLLAVILPKPIPRWQILLGKWLGLNAILVGSTLVWTTMVWASLTWQTRDLHVDWTPLLTAGFSLSLFPIVLCTLALSLSTFAPRLFGTSLALTLAAFAWFDGIFNGLGAPAPRGFDVPFLRGLADAAGLIVPQGTISWWVEDATARVIMLPPGVGAPWKSPQFIKSLGETYLHFGHLDAVYVALYIVAVFAIGAFIFRQRDVAA